MCRSYLLYSHIWLNLPKDDRHFGYKQKFLKNTALESGLWTETINSKTVVLPILKACCRPGA